MTRTKLGLLKEEMVMLADYFSQLERLNYQVQSERERIAGRIETVRNEMVAEIAKGNDPVKTISFILEEIH